MLNITNKQNNKYSIGQPGQLLLLFSSSESELSELDEPSELDELSEFVELSICSVCSLSGLELISPA